MLTSLMSLLGLLGTSRFLKCYTQWLGWDNRVKEVYFWLFFTYDWKNIKRLRILTDRILFQILCSTPRISVTFTEKSTELGKNSILVIFWPRKLSFFNHSNRRIKFFPNIIDVYWSQKNSAKSCMIVSSLRQLFKFLLFLKHPKNRKNQLFNFSNWRFRKVPDMIFSY